jgi:hypothetical protein
LLKIGVANATKLCESLEKQSVHFKIGENEKAIFMIDDVFIQNRVRSVKFMSEVEHLIQVKKETLTVLGESQIELSSKIQSIEEDRLDMKK